MLGCSAASAAEAGGGEKYRWLSALSGPVAANDAQILIICFTN
jgi:hypothetical protein